MRRDFEQLTVSRTSTDFTAFNNWAIHLKSLWSSMFPLHLEKNFSLPRFNLPLQMVFLVYPVRQDWELYSLGIAYNYLYETQYLQYSFIIIFLFLIGVSREHKCCILNHFQVKFDNLFIFLLSFIIATYWPPCSSWHPHNYLLAINWNTKPNLYILLSTVHNLKEFQQREKFNLVMNKSEDSLLYPLHLNY